MRALHPFVQIGVRGLGGSHHRRDSTVSFRSRAANRQLLGVALAPEGQFFFEYALRFGYRAFLTHLALVIFSKALIEALQHLRSKLRASQAPGPVPGLGHLFIRRVQAARFHPALKFLPACPLK